MWGDILIEADRLRVAGEPFVIATVVAFQSPQSARPGAKAIVRPDGSITGWVGGGCVQPIIIREARKALQTGRPKLVSISPEPAREEWEGVESYAMTCEGGGSLEIYLEPVVPRPELLILGRSPVAHLLAGLGRLLDFKVCLADAEASPEQFPEADLVLTDLSLVRGRIGEHSFVVVATMGTGDEECLEAVVGASARYTGLIASREKAKSLFQYLREKGATAEQLGRVRCPAGLALGAETLPEIALSIMAEITQLRRAQTADAAPAGKSVALPLLPVAAPAGAAEAGAAEARDPICGMMVATQDARYKSVIRDQTIYFCCRRCQETFDRSPQSYLA